jgi:uncharacterized linocin/CFP29 family protein
MTQTPQDRVEYSPSYLPMPIVHKDVTLSLRELNAMQNQGRHLDTDHIEEATEAVSSKIEDMLFNGDETTVYGGGQVYGYTTEPNANSVDLSANWDASGADIIGDVNNLRRAAIEDNRTGPYVLYYPPSYSGVMGEDYKTYVSKSVRNRILEIPDIDDVKLSTKLPAHTVVLVEMRSRTVRLVNPVEIRAIQWNVEGGMGVRFKILAIMTPQVRSDAAGQSGIVIGT